MTVETPGRLSGTDERAWSDYVPDPRPTAVFWPRGLAIALAILALAALTAVWPALTLLGMGVALIIGLAAFAPPFALVGAILFYGLEGAIKVGLARELPAVGVGPDAFGAALMDFAFVVAVLGLLRQDRGRSLLRIWRNAGHWLHVALLLLAAWIAISFVQLIAAGDLGAALAGFRLTQAYVVAVVAGAMLLARWRPEHVVAALLVVLLVVAAYASFRAVAGPSTSERLAAFARSTTPVVPSDEGVIFRNTGSFSSATGLASFLVPAGVFLFTLGLFFVRMRMAAWIGFALVLVALVGSYVRMSLLAVAGGMLFAAALLTFASGLARRRKLAVALAGIPLLVVLVTVGALLPRAVSGGSEAVEQRAAGLMTPLSDESVTTRLERWGQSLDVARSQPFGTGLGTVGRATLDEHGAVHAFTDNSYLKILEEQGLLGAIPFTLGILVAFVALTAQVARRGMPLRGWGAAAVAGSASFFLLAWTSEAIEQPGKVLGWLLLGVALWTVAGAPRRERAPAGREVAGDPSIGWGLSGLLPGWVRARRGLVVALLLIAVPVAVSLLRQRDFEIALEALPTTPAGNAAGAGGDLPVVREMVANPGFRLGLQGWRGHPGFALRHSSEEAHSGTASLASVRDAGGSQDGRVASTRAVLPAPGRYAVQAWVRLPEDYGAAAPRVELAGFSASSRLAEHRADPALRGRWQLIASEYVMRPQDLDGLIVLRAGPSAPDRGQALHWDDVRVLSNDVNLPAPDEVNLVSNPGLEHDGSGWGDGPAFATDRSQRFAHTGSASLRSAGDQRAAHDTNAGHSYVVVPRAGTYVVKAWVYIPTNMRGSRPGVFLEGFSGSRETSRRPADPGRRGVWQWVSAEYEISPQDLEGSVVLRELAGNAGGRVGTSAGTERVLYWDDVSVTAPPPDRSGDAREAAARLRAALEEPQLRFDIAAMTSDDTLYDPGRTTVERSLRKGSLSFIVKVGGDVPQDANRLAGPVRAALVDAGRRGKLRQAQERWQQLIARVGETLPPGRRALLQARARIVERMIGAQPANVVAVPGPAPDSAATTLTDAQRRQVHDDRQKVISRIGDGLPPWQRALVRQQADDLQRMIAADTPEFVVLPAQALAEPTRRVDRLLARLPGSLPVRAHPAWAGMAGVVCALVLLGMLIAINTARQRRAAGGR